MADEPDAEAAREARALIDRAVELLNGTGGEHYVVAGWMLLIDLRGADEDGEISGVRQYDSGGSLPWTQVLGILRAATLRAEWEMHHKVWGDS